MRALILAAGRGSRMGSTTANHPKCLTLFRGKALLDWQLEALRGAKISRIAVVRGYLASTLHRESLEYFENIRWPETNMVRSLMEARTWLSEDSCVISYSDIVYSKSAVEKLIASEGDIVIAYDPNWLTLWSKRFANPLDDAETFKRAGDGRLTEIGNKTQSLEDIKGQYMGLLKFTPAGWKKIESFFAALEPLKLDKMDMTTLLRGLLTRGETIMTTAIADSWYEVDSESDLHLYEKWILEKGGSVF